MFQKTESKIIEYEKKNQQIEEKSRQYTKAIRDIAANAVSETGGTAHENVILSLSEQDLRIEGLPIESLNIDVLLSIWKEDRKKFESLINQQEKELTTLLQERNDLKIETDSLKRDLEAEQKKGWFSKFISWITGFGITGIVIAIIGLILAPQIFLPLLSALIGWVISFAPQLINFIGLIGKKTFDNVVVAVEEIRTKVKLAPEDKRYTKKEVQDLINETLRASLNDEEKKIIEQRKRTLRLKK